MGWGGFAGAGARGPARSRVKLSGCRRPRGDLEHRADEDADHVAHEGVGGDRGSEPISPSPSQSAARTSRVKRTWSVWVGVKAVKSWVPTQGGGAGVEGGAVERVRPPEGPAPLERARASGLARGSDSSREWRRGARRSRRDDRRGGHRDVGGLDAVEPAGEVGGQARRRSRSSRPGRRACDAGVGAAGDGQLDGPASIVASAVSSSPCTVRSPGCRAQPLKPAPSYSISSGPCPGAQYAATHAGVPRRAT